METLVLWVLAGASVAAGVGLLRTQDTTWYGIALSLAAFLAAAVFTSGAFVALAIRTARQRIVREIRAAGALVARSVGQVSIDKQAHELQRVR